MTVYILTLFIYVFLSFIDPQKFKSGNNIIVIRLEICVFCAKFFLIIWNDQIRYLSVGLFHGERWVVRHSNWVLEHLEKGWSGQRFTIEVVAILRSDEVRTERALLLLIDTILVLSQVQTMCSRSARAGTSSSTTKSRRERWVLLRLMVRLLGVIWSDTTRLTVPLEIDLDLRRKFRE